ncbi:MAG: SRPBCC family protein [Acidimicrobiia bacterium]|nr:SRPBCC family protein [Acidimicrobiia bacterium]
MTNTQTQPDGRLVEVDGAYQIEFERVYPHPIEEVWDAITNPARIAKWWLPFDADIELDLRPGGKYELRAKGPEAMEISWTVVRVEPPTLFEHTHSDIGGNIRWMLHDEGGATRLELVQTPADRNAVIEMGFIVGLHMSLDRLGRDLDGVADNPWDWDVEAVHKERYAENGLARQPT